MDTDKNDNNLKKPTFLEDFIDNWKQQKQIKETQKYNDAFSKGEQSQKEIDLISMIRAFLELNVKEDKMRQLLLKYFYIDSVTEGTRLIRTAKRHNFIDYLLACGMKLAEIDNYDLPLKEYIQSDNPNIDKMLDMPPEKLKIHLDKIKALF